MIFKTEMYGISCDTCSVEFECENTGIYATTDEIGIRTLAVYSGWTENNGEVTCIECLQNEDRD